MSFRTKVLINISYGLLVVTPRVSYQRRLPLWVSSITDLSSVSGLLSSSLSIGLVPWSCLLGFYSLMCNVRDVCES